MREFRLLAEILKTAFSPEITESDSGSRLPWQVPTSALTPRTRAACVASSSRTTALEGAKRRREFISLLLHLTAEQTVTAGATPR